MFVMFAEFHCVVTLMPYAFFRQCFFNYVRVYENKFI